MNTTAQNNDPRVRQIVRDYEKRYGRSGNVLTNEVRDALVARLVMYVMMSQVHEAQPIRAYTDLFRDSLLALGMIEHDPMDE